MNKSFRWFAAALSCAAFATSAQTVVLYSSNNPEVIANAVASAKKQHPSLTVKQVTGGTGTLMKRIQAEAANAGGDILWSGGVGTLAAFTDVMESYQSPEAKAIP